MGVRDGVSVGNGVGMGVGEGVNVGVVVGVRVEVIVAVGVEVGVGVIVRVGVGVSVMVGNGVTDEVGVGVRDGTNFGEREGYDTLSGLYRGGNVGKNLPDCAGGTVVKGEAASVALDLSVSRTNNGLMHISPIKTPREKGRIRTVFPTPALYHEGKSDFNDASHTEIFNKIGPDFLIF